ncbi:MAG: 16S rRNA (uracil(1498)-N(3))-methyltransferase, partial [Pseudomonadota bacterium]
AIMKFNECFKYPRLFTPHSLAAEASVTLETDQLHYLKNVLRKSVDDCVRVFNGADGEWLGQISVLEKKRGELTLTEQFKQQPSKEEPLHLIFAPIKKGRMDFLIEKAVELGVTDIHPVMTARTEARNLKTQRLQSHIIEAAEQCERLSLARLHKEQSLNALLQSWDAETPVYWGAERHENAEHLANIKDPKCFLIGPEGGFDDEETRALENHKDTIGISLGEQILRAETAALFCLSHAKLSRNS